jgi:hypothetical protein
MGDMTQEFHDQYYLADTQQCSHVHVERSGKKKWICERTEGHDGPHDATPVHLPRPIVPKQGVAQNDSVAVTQ